jgi:NAD+ kinase
MVPSEQSGPETVGVVGDAELSAAVEDAGARAVTGGPEEVLTADPSWLLAVGERALLSLVRAGASAPVLPVDAGDGVASVPRADAAAAVRSVREGVADETSRTLLSVDHDGETTTALFDVMLVTAEAARISEYTLRSGTSRVARFRADGVVVASPAGSPGYANDVGGPVVGPGTGVASVVPVAPFVTDADHWIVALDDLRLGVDREEPVSVLVDDREWRTIGRDATVRVGTGGSIEVFLAPQGRRFPER